MTNVTRYVTLLVDRDTKGKQASHQERPSRSRNGTGTGQRGRKGTERTGFPRRTSHSKLKHSRASRSDEDPEPPESKTRAERRNATRVSGQDPLARFWPRGNAKPSRSRASAQNLGPPLKCVPGQKKNGREDRTGEQDPRRPEKGRAGLADLGRNRTSQERRGARLARPLRRWSREGAAGQGTPKDPMSGRLFGAGKALRAEVQGVARQALCSIP